VLGDVAGKGPPAALLAAQLHGILAALANLDGTPADILTRANRVLLRREPESHFATAVYGLLSGDGHFTYCNAGHNPPLLVGRHGVQRLETGGLILGAFKDVIFRKATLRLDPGDVLVVFSDGITEALNADGAEFGEERLLSCVNSCRELEPADILECIVGAVHTFTADTVQSDDQTALVLRYSGA
jgi:sigma-B regulation protein RsbU (phosphoserine phosphatase)